MHTIFTTYRLLAAIMLFSAMQLYSCKSDKPPARKINVRLMDSVVLDVSPQMITSPGLTMINYNGHKCMAAVRLNRGNPSFDLFYMDGKEKGKKADISRLSQKLLQYKDYDATVYSADSIFVYDRVHDHLMLMDFNGGTHHTWRVNILYKNDSLTLVGADFRFGTDIFDAGSGIYYKRTFPSVPHTAQQFFNHQTFVAIKLEGDTGYIQNRFSNFPSFYTNQYYGITLSINNISQWKENIFLTFYLSDSVYSYNAKTKQVKPAFYAGSAYVTPSKDLFDTTRLLSNEYNNQFSCEHSSYGNLVTSPHSAYLYRIAEHKYHYYNEDSTINKGYLKPWSLVVLNHNLTVVGEILFPADKLNNWAFLPTDKGFWIADAENANKYYYYEMDHL